VTEFPARRKRRTGRWLPEGLGTLSCPACWFRMDPLIPASGWDRHPGCSGWPDGSRVETYARFENARSGWGTGWSG
jgi:hypothetical protein